MFRPGGVPVRLGDVANIQLEPEMRRGVTELNGQGEVVGGVVIPRSGKNVRTAIVAVKAKLAELQKCLPHGVQIVPNRSQLIDRGVENLTHKMIEEFIVVAVVCGPFLPWPVCRKARRVSKRVGRQIPMTCWPLHATGTTPCSSVHKRWRDLDLENGPPRGNPPCLGVRWNSQCDPGQIPSNCADMPWSLRRPHCERN